MSVDNSLTPVESLLTAIPLGSSPAGRIVLFGGGGIALAYALRPSLSFDEKGKPRPWIVFDPSNVEATAFPYWAYGVVPALLMGVFV